MSVHRLSLNDSATEEKWDNFVLLQSKASFFHRSEWQRIITQIFHHECYFLYVENKGKIVGILPLAHVKSPFFGKSLISLPFGVYGGVAAVDQTTANLLEKEAQKLAEKLGVDYLEFRNIDRKHENWPLQELYVTFRKEIFSNTEANLLAIPRKQRAMIRKGINFNLTSFIGYEIDQFYSLYTDNMHRHGSPVLPKKYFQLMLQEFKQDCDILSICDKNGKVISSVFSFYFRDQVLPYYAGDLIEARELAANDFKYWELMRRSGERGCKIFDFGRSKRDTGSYSFKKNWGFEVIPLHYEYCLYRRESIPQNNPSNAKFDLPIKLWRKLPLRLANYLGPYIVRGLG